MVFLPPDSGGGAPSFPSEDPHCFDYHQEDLKYPAAAGFPMNTPDLAYHVQEQQVHTPTLLLFVSECKTAVSVHSDIT